MIKKQKASVVPEKQIPVMVNFPKQYVDLLERRGEELNLPKGKVRATVCRSIVIGELKKLYPELAKAAGGN